MSEKPLVEVPDGEPTGKQLGIVDIITGDGEQAQAGHLAEVHYVCLLYTSDAADE